MKTDIVVWDMKLGREQAHIHCEYNYGVLPDHDLLWSRNGKIISFGARRQWDPMSGEALPDNPAIGRGARLNKDGSKMLAIVGAIGEPSYIYIYDTETWDLQKLYVDGLHVGFAAWTADDKILVSVNVTKEAFGKVLDGHPVEQWNDTALMLLDPSGKESIKAKWFPPKPTGNPAFPFVVGFPFLSNAKTNFPTNQVFLGAGKIIDGATLEIRTYLSFDTESIAPGGFGLGFSPDGRLLYLKGANFQGDRAPMLNSIVDTASGEPLVQFDGGMSHQGGLAVSPDGEYLALGDGHSVLVFNLK